MATKTHDSTTADPLSIGSIALDFGINFVTIVVGFFLTLVIVAGDGGSADLFSLAGVLLAAGAAFLPACLATLAQMARRSYRSDT